MIRNHKGTMNLCPGLLRSCRRKKKCRVTSLVVRLWPAISTSLRSQEQQDTTSSSLLFDKWEFQRGFHGPLAFTVFLPPRSSWLCFTTALFGTVCTSKEPQDVDTSAERSVRLETISHIDYMAKLGLHIKKKTSCSPCWQSDATRCLLTVLIY